MHHRGGRKVCAAGRTRRARAAALAATTAAGFLACPALIQAAAAMPDGNSGGEGGGGGLPFQTVIVVDAGSSGCRLNVYHVNEEGESVTVSGMAGGKIEPGLSSFADRPADAAAHVKPLLLAASELVPQERHANTKVVIKSTAGMRLLPEYTQEAIYDEIYDAIAADSLFPFRMEREELGTIGGDMEAFYAVLSANYLEGRIDARLHPTGHAAGEIGALDMGGASTQIIFRRGLESEGGLEVVIDPEEYLVELQGEEGVLKAGGTTVAAPVTPSDFWGMSHLGYGVTEVRARVWDYVVDEHIQAGGAGTEIMENPCSFVDRVDTWKGHRLVGTGDHSSCEKVVKLALWEEDSHTCGAHVDRACGVGGIAMPPPRGEFVAMSVFFYAMHCLHDLGPAELPSWPNPSLAEIRSATEAFCAMDWKAMMHEDEAAGIAKASHAFTGSTEALAHRCVEAVYMTTLLRDGYGFEEHSRNVTFALESEGMELEWTLGYALAELAEGLNKLKKPSTGRPSRESDTARRRGVRHGVSTAEKSSVVARLVGSSNWEEESESGDDETAIVMEPDMESVGEPWGSVAVYCDQTADGAERNDPYSRSPPSSSSSRRRKREGETNSSWHRCDVNTGDDLTTSSTTCPSSNCGGSMVDGQGSGDGKGQRAAAAGGIGRDLFNIAATLLAVLSSLWWGSSSSESSTSSGWGGASASSASPGALAVTKCSQDRNSNDHYWGILEFPRDVDGGRCLVDGD